MGDLTLVTRRTSKHALANVTLTRSVLKASSVINAPTARGFPAVPATVAGTTGITVMTPTGRKTIYISMITLATPIRDLGSSTTSVVPGLTQARSSVVTVGVTPARSM